MLPIINKIGLRNAGGLKSQIGVFILGSIPWYNFYFDEDRSDKDLTSRVAISSYAWPYASCPKLYKALYGTDGDDATGRIEIVWTPTALADAVILDMGTSDNVIYTHATEIITVTDGTNTITAAHTAVVGESVSIVINYDAYGMSLEVS